MEKTNPLPDTHTEAVTLRDAVALLAELIDDVGEFHVYKETIDADPKIEFESADGDTWIVFARPGYIGFERRPLYYEGCLGDWRCETLDAFRTGLLALLKGGER